MYTFNSRVRYSETDSKARLSLEGIVNYLQDCSTFHSEDVGLGLNYHKGINRAWLLASWQIVIDRYPKMGERITIWTNPYDHDKLYAYRNFAILSESGEILIKANSIWVYVDTLNNKPVRVKDEDITSYMANPKIAKLEMDYAPRKFKIPKDGTEMEKIEVMSHHLDTNRHVNNGQYVRFACEYLPDDVMIREIRAEYRTAAKLGNIIVPRVSLTKRGCVVALGDEEGNSKYAAVEFIF